MRLRRTQRFSPIAVRVAGLGEAEPGRRGARDERVGTLPTGSLRACSFAACFSRELADFTIQVIDVCGGDKIPRKGGPGITQSDLLVINKTDLAAGVGADLKVMERDTKRMRGGGPFVFAQVKNGVGVDEIISHVLHHWQHAAGIEHQH